ncbi:MAG: hypothetical protein L3J53_06960 [Proteobacteria bacterium]|nr:hypothetical protein [Pseudomonadota bacterium]
MIENINMINGDFIIGGGILSDRADVALLLDNVDIRNNTATAGAGIAIVGGDTDLLMRETLVLGNVADFGGGIYCRGGASSVNVANHSGIIANTANGTPSFPDPDGQGAGAYIDGCYFAIFTGSPNSGSFIGMSRNISEGAGGAIYAKDAIIRLHGHQHCGSQGCLGDNINPVSFHSNSSSSSFGTAVLHAINSDVKMNAISIVGNAGWSLIRIIESELVIERFTQPCWSNSDCNLIENNSGTVIADFTNGGQDINISSVNIRGNSGRVFDISARSSRSVRVEGSMITDNNSLDHLLRFEGPVDVDFIHTTIADNQVSGSIFRTDFWLGFSEPGPTVLDIHSSIISNPGHDVYSFNESDFSNGDKMLITVSATMVNETNSISASSTLINDAANIGGGTLLSTANPLFVDRNNGNYHLSANSPAIDYFHTPSRATVLYPDIDFQTRGVDDPDTSGAFLFYYDLGADEYIFLGEEIFNNGFE